ncbi:MAG: Hsp33 family molecular chaperone HslO [Candidatus Cloacimonetes bacterium]|nr:Hsp33 family molecular chaperone HslO [Candidatus Cloacimonadota bacterium]
MTDSLLRGITRDKSLRFFAVNAADTVQQAIDFHYLSITSSVTLGRLLVAGLLMGAGLKNAEDLLTLRIDGDGPIGVVLVTATGDGTIKGYVQNPQIELAKSSKGFAVAEAVGKGYLSVIRSMTGSKPYTGQVALVSGEIGQDICHYYQQSEQMDTLVNLGILIEKDAVIRQAAGVFVQCMPDTPVEVKTLLNANAQQTPNLSDLLDMGMSLEDILQKFIFKNIPIDIADQKPVSYFCNCTKDRFSAGMRLLDKQELKEMIESNEAISASCHFCNKNYKFSTDELQEMLRSKI